MPNRTLTLRPRRPAPAPRTRATQRPATYDDEAGIVTVDGIGYEFDTLPAATQRALGMRGLAQAARIGGPDAYKRIAAGTVGRAPAKPKELDPRDEAVALALADERLERFLANARQGGEKLTAAQRTDYHGAQVAIGRSFVAGLHKDELKRLRGTPGAVAHYRRLTGQPVSLLAMLGGEPQG